MENHEAGWCFINPASVQYRPDVRSRRVQQAIRKGIKLPDYLQDPSPTTINMVQEGDPRLVHDIKAALDLVGLLSPEGVEARTDEIL
jgi:hypothetical protein